MSRSSRRSFALRTRVERLAILAGSITALTGCSGPPGEEAQRSASAALATPASTALACSASQVAWDLAPAGTTATTCSAGVSYSNWNDCTKSIPASYSSNGCPEQDLANPPLVVGNVCSYALSYTNAVMHGAAPTATQCGFPTAPFCRRVVESGLCGQIAQTNAASIQSGGKGVYVGTGSGAAAGVNFGAGASYAGDASQSGATCTWTIDHYPTMLSATNGTECGYHNVAQPPTPYWPACSLPNPDACGATRGTLPPGGTFAQVPDPKDGIYPNGNLDTEACISGEDIPLPTDGSDPTAQVQKKWSLLTTNFASASSGSFPGVDDTTLVAPILDEMKLLFETYGNYLTVDQQSVAVDLYLEYPTAADTPACGQSNAAFTAPSIPSCAASAASITTLNDEMSFCARMTDFHVTDAVRALTPVLALCVTKLAADVGALRASLLVNGPDDGTASPPVTAEGGASEGGASEDGGDDAGVGPDDVCAFRSYRAQYDAFVTSALSARFSRDRDPRNAADQPEVIARLRALDAWYAAVTTNLYPYNSSERLAPAVRAAGLRDATGLEATLWRGMYRQIFAADGVTAVDGGTLALADGSASGGGVLPPTFGAASITALTQDTLDADRAVLGLLFPPAGTSSPPMTGPALLMVLGDAFEAMSQRMHDIGVYHDMGCAYLGCGAGARTELVLLMELLAALPDSTALTSALTNATRIDPGTNQPAVRPLWTSVYSAILSGHGAIESAVQSAVQGVAGGDGGAAGAAGWSYVANGEPLLETSGSSGPAQHLAGLVQAAGVATSTYGVDGLFNPAPRNRLPAGIAQDNVDAIRAGIQSRTTALSTIVGNFDAQLTELASSVVQEMTATTTMTNSLDEITQRMNDIVNLNANIAGLRNSLEANNDALASMATAYAQSTAFDTNVTLSGSSYGPWLLDATSAKAGGPLGAGMDVSPYSQVILDTTGATPTTARFTKGTIVTVQATGQWAPTCALSLENTRGGLEAPGSTVRYPLDLSSALTGPAGFTVALSDGQGTVKADQTGSSSNSSFNVAETTNICAGYQVPMAIFSIQSCLDLSHSNAWTSTSSSSTTSSDNSTTSVNFASGLRLTTTPVPAAPVGSLLAIITDAGKPSSLRDIRVVQAPATSMIMDADSNVYLLTNDIADGPCNSDRRDALTVGVTTTQHAGPALSWVQNALGSVSSLLDGFAEPNGTSTTPNIPAASLVAQGQLTPDQAAEIRSTAMLTLVRACNADPTVTDKTLCDTSKLPETVLEFITNTIDRGIEGIEFQIEILQATRSLTSLVLQEAQLVDDYNAAGAQADVAALIPQWTLRNLDTNLLQDETAQLVDSVTYDLYPVLQLRYPDVFAAGLANDGALQSALQTLTTAQWDQPVSDLATAAVRAATALYDDTQALTTTDPGLAPKPIALDFVRPGVVVKQPPFLTADEGRAGTVWAATASASHIVDLHIEYEDLYRSAGGTNLLLCTEQVPVIRDMAIVLAGSRLGTSDQTFFDNKDFGVRSWIDAAHLGFPMAATYTPAGDLYSSGGPLEFSLKNLDWSSLDTQVMVSVDPGAAVSTYLATRSDLTKNVNGKGLSPFTDFYIDLSSLYDPNVIAIDRPVDLADHLIVVMQVEYRPVAPDKTMSWISRCQ